MALPLCIGIAVAVLLLFSPLAWVYLYDLAATPVEASGAGMVSRSSSDLLENASDLLGNPASPALSESNKATVKNWRALPSSISSQS